MIKVTTHPVLQKIGLKRDGYFEIPYEEGLTVEKLKALLKINFAEVGLILVNGKYAKNDCILSHEDTVEFYPIFGGG